MRRVVIESHYAGDVEANLAYAKRCVHDCLARGEAPYASHLLFTQAGILDDLIPEERRRGIESGFASRRDRKRTAQIARMRAAGADYTEIGRRFGVSRQRIQQIVARQASRRVSEDGGPRG